LRENAKKKLEQADAKGHDLADKAQGVITPDLENLSRAQRQELFEIATKVEEEWAAVAKIVEAAEQELREAAE
jgi:hypothetical protein